MANAFYSFLPYIRQGFNKLLTNQDNYEGSTGASGQRVEVNIQMNIDKESVSGGITAASLSKNIQLRSPVDVKGINTNAIVKVSPSNWVTNFEPNYLPYIEFYDEDFCWRYTPAKARNEHTATNKFRLRPWLALVVLKENEFINDPFLGDFTSITLTQDSMSVLPKQNELWAWAHVHVNDNLSQDESAIGSSSGGTINQAVEKLQDIIGATPDKGVSRIICPRRLEPNTAYHAFLIPTFEGGRLAGLNKEIPASLKMTDPAWSAANSDWQFPVYHTWYFKTGGAGDFESLVRLLQPRVLNNAVGKRTIDLQKSNNPLLEAVELPEGQHTSDMQGVVQPVSTIEEEWDFQSDYAETLRDIINKPTEILEVIGGDPVIAPPIYGRWHALKNQVASVASEELPDWIQEVNLDPRLRLMAGAGSEIVRRNQETYMEAVWSQVGEVMEANSKLRLLQLSKQASKALYEKHLETLNDELLVNISGPIHQRIINQPEEFTVFKDISDSILPTELFSGAFRRLTRTAGAISRSIELETGSLVTTTELIADINSGDAEVMGPYEVPLGMIPYTIWEASELTSTFTASLATISSFEFTSAGIPLATVTSGPPSSAGIVLTEAIGDFHGVIESIPEYAVSTAPSLSLSDARNIILTRTEPYNNTITLAKKAIKLNSIEDVAINVENLNPVMAFPRIKVPMYQELAKLSPDWMMPGMNDIQMNSINMLEHNQKYVEAFMLGLNHEMNREMLWRGYPTDQRATVFSYFWGYNNSMTSVLQPKKGIFNLESYKDIKDIHLWGMPPASLSLLGTNSARTLGSDMCILVIRGELLRKFPGTIIHLQKSKWKVDAGTGDPIFTQAREYDELSTPVYPIFSGKLEPDIYFLGFNKTAEEIRGGTEDVDNPGYFVVFQERAGEVRFGADEYDAASSYPSVLANWDDINWNYLKNDPLDDGYIDLTKTISVTSNPDNVLWNANSASVAYALLQSPVKLSVHAHGLIPE